ncbi:PREDICTED: receptor expression-enhancing protein 5 isoform X1 [Drosophila arizonae]|uniref:Receptor expression-enhancing protein n=1 Tax=Drosophila arizonae TaxID=7263 RepID=A0ABM1PHM0_DROAR|nr:PREDICTED: receptor expression-enhancing protein 5 isoform X1 [Drosophila arizonae]
MSSQLTQIPQMFENYKETVRKSLRDPNKPWTKAFDILEERTSVDRVNLFSGAVALCAIYLIFGCWAQLVCNIIGVLYPAYVSIHAIESSTKQDDTKWLIYWVTFGIFTVIEFFSHIVTNIIPLYWLLKCGFLIWCMLPVENNGSVIIYNKLVRPYFLKHHASVDKIIDDGIRKAGNVLKKE